MKITLSKHAGFCPGVRRADNTIKALINSSDSGKIYTLGQLIHNRLYNAELSELGVESLKNSDIENLLDLQNDTKITLVIRTHGIPKEQYEYLQNLSNSNPNLNLVDMTCPYVKRIHEIADKNTDSSTVFLLFCDPNHPEAIGTLSYAHGEKYPFSSLEELKNIEIGKKTPVLCSQTTQNLSEFKRIKKFLEKLYTNSIFFDTICSVTENRQNEAIKIAKDSDAMIVIGGRESSNTHKLYDLCSGVCPRTLWIESQSELTDSVFFDGANSVGITAGASTPDGIITEVLKLWKKTKK